MQAYYPEKRSPSSPPLSKKVVTQAAAETHFMRLSVKIQILANFRKSVYNDILDLSKIEARKMTFSPEKFELATLINGIVLTVKPLVDKNGNHLEVDCDQELGLVYTDQTKLRQVLYNLLSNAAKFTTNGKVKLVIKKEKVDLPEDAFNGIISFIVIDTGIGMSHQQLQQLFQPFIQGDASTTKRYGGIGLGLAISRHFCHMMGGEIFVKSELGQGSTFTACLPVNINFNEIQQIIQN